MASNPSKASNIIDLSDVFQAKPMIQHEPPEDFSPEHVTLAELNQLERTLVQNPNARWTTAQRVFFEALLSSPTMDPKDAAKKAGVKPGQAKRWLSNPATQEALNFLMTKRVQAVGIDANQLLRRMYSSFQMALGEKPIYKTYQHEGVLYTDEVRHTDLQAAARFADLLAKHFQLYAPEQEAATGINIQLNLGGSPVNRTLEHEDND